VVIRENAETLEDALRRVTPTVTTVINQVRSLASPPEKINLEFGVKLTAEAGVVIAKAAAEANFKLSLEWTTTSSAPEKPKP
jgi:hypothetical protein